MPPNERFERTGCERRDTAVRRGDQKFATPARARAGSGDIAQRITSVRVTNSRAAAWLNRLLQLPGSLPAPPDQGRLATDSVGAGAACPAGCSRQPGNSARKMLPSPTCDLMTSVAW